MRLWSCFVGNWLPDLVLVRGLLSVAAVAFTPPPPFGNVVVVGIIGTSFDYRPFLCTKNPEDLQHNTIISFSFTVVARMDYLRKSCSALKWDNFDWVCRQLLLEREEVIVGLGKSLVVSLVVNFRHIQRL